MSNKKHESESVVNQLVRKIKALVLPYIIATLFYQLVSTHKIVLLEYLEHLVRFDITAPFYFIVFYLQLSVIGIILSKIIQYTKYDFLVILFSLIISSACIKYTYILPLWGGGQFLFGGSYLFVYTVGIILAKKLKTIRISNIRIIISGIILVTYSILFVKYEFTLDRILGEPFGTGLNPPGITLIMYSMIVLSFVFFMLSFAQNSNNIFVKKCFTMLCIVGQNSYYIFLYHRLILDFFLGKLIIDNIWLQRILDIILMIGIPIIIKYIVEDIKRRYSKLMYGE